MAYAKNYQGQEEFYTLFQKDVLNPRLLEVENDYKQLNSWPDMIKTFESLPEKDRNFIWARFKMIETQAFKKPKLTSTPAGFIIESEGRELTIDFIAGELTLGDKKFSLKGQSVEQIFAWFENQTKTVSHFIFFISDAHAFPFPPTFPLFGIYLIKLAGKAKTEYLVKMGMQKKSLIP